MPRPTLAYRLPPAGPRRARQRPLYVTAVALLARRVRLWAPLPATASAPLTPALTPARTPARTPLSLRLLGLGLAATVLGWWAVGVSVALGRLLPWGSLALVPAFALWAWGGAAWAALAAALLVLTATRPTRPTPPLRPLGGYHAGSLGCGAPSTALARLTFTWLGATALPYAPAPLPGLSRAGAPGLRPALASRTLLARAALTTPWVAAYGAPYAVLTAQAAFALGSLEAGAAWTATPGVAWARGRAAALGGMQGAAALRAVVRGHAATRPPVLGLPSAPSLRLPRPTPLGLVLTLRASSVSVPGSALGAALWRVRPHAAPSLPL